MSALFARFVLFAMLLLPIGEVWAASAVVEAVRMPAWRERGDLVEPLLPGQQINEGDRIRTGSGACAYLKLPEGSTVKLGEAALLSYPSRTAAQDKSIFKAALNVAAGAFRFTTAAVAKLRKRDVAIRVGTATIGIRGTDVWGRSGKDDDLVMLIEGRVEVQPAQGEALQLDEALTVFTAPKGGAANPLTHATPEELKARARETEILPGDGAIRQGGKRKRVLGSFDDEQKALALYDQVRAAGYGASIQPLLRDGGNAGYRYEVVLSGFATKDEAANTAARLKRSSGIGTIPLE